MVSAYPKIKINEKRQQSNPGRMTKDWVTLQRKESRLAEELAEGGGNSKWEAEKGSYEYQLVVEECNYGHQLRSYDQL